MPITTTVVEISEFCTGDRWEVTDEESLATLVGLIAKCEFAHAQSILSGNTSTTPVYTSQQEQEIKQHVIDSLTLELDADGIEKRTPAKWHRDGFLFEAISWIVARQANSDEVLMRDPHIGATTQGLDGLMIELTPAHDDVVKTIVMEDKCVEDAKYTFQYETLPALEVYHVQSRKVLESATTLLRQAVPVNTITAVAAKAINLSVRSYRASLTIDTTGDTQPARAAIFKNYERLGGILKDNRIGCTFLASDNIRDWFEQFSKKVIKNL